MRALIYEVAGTGSYGNIPQVERIKMYDFFNFLAYKREGEKEIERLYAKK